MNYDKGGHASPSSTEETAEGGGEPSTIERPRVRARFVDHGEAARPPEGGRRHDPMPPPSPGETSAGPSTLSEAAVPVEGGAEARPYPKKRHQKRLQSQRQSGNALTPGRRAGDRTEPMARPGERRTGLWDWGRASTREVFPCTCVEYGVVCPC